MDRLLTPQQLADLLQIKQSTVYKWAHYRYVPYVKIGNLLRFKEVMIEKWVNNKCRKGRAKYKQMLEIVE